jgi:hypothetical protein
VLFSYHTESRLDFTATGYLTPINS